MTNGEFRAELACRWWWLNFPAMWNVIAHFMMAGLGPDSL